ncbi:MAG: phosphoribosylaminoimidazolesuccinocarboxamide synthase [Candidatus Schekmanbacteria bacterium]|nr:phosphoribosylaminoimidazolesuccinocarboxamide synthase [Candidatus Schekmanbacteria bacterium]
MGENYLYKETVSKTNFSGLKLVKRGKVRDIYDLGDKLLIVATDRLSAFDVILPNGIPYKGKVLTALSKFWFDKIKDVVPIHVVSFDVKDYPPECAPYKETLRGRSMLVLKTEVIPVECVVRGYLSGSAFEEYKRTGGTVSGINLGAGLVESSKLKEPIFTPSTKAEAGHDENITFEQMKGIVGSERAEKLKEYTLNVYKRACSIAEQRGIIIADTKFEFGILKGQIYIIDEVLTPDSSRFWPMDDYAPGRPQKSFDKQFVRDYLLTLDWDKTPPAPELPEDVILKTSKKYLDALEKLADVKL